jgi:hypothetical protein
VYGAGVLDPSGWLAEMLWRVDPAVEGVYGPFPNAAGMKMIEQALADLIR